MSLQALRGLLESAPQYRRMQQSLDVSRARERVQVPSGGVPMTLATLWGGLDVPVLVITPKSEDARRLCDQVLLWTDDERRIVQIDV